MSKVFQYVAERGMITLKISGPSGCGKTLLATHIYREFEAEGKKVRLVDEYLHRDTLMRRAKDEAIAAAESDGIDVLIICGENV